MNTIDFGFFGNHDKRPVNQSFDRFHPNSQPNGQTLRQPASDENALLDQIKPTMACSAEQQRLWLARGVALGKAFRWLSHTIRTRSTIFLALLLISAALYADPVREQLIRETLANYEQVLAVYCQENGCGPMPTGVERKLHEHPDIYMYKQPEYGLLNAYHQDMAQDASDGDRLD